MHLSDLHHYIHSVIETGDHGPCRLIEFDLKTLDDAIERHAEGIAKRINEHEGTLDTLQTLGLQEQVTVHNFLGNIKFQCTVETPSNLEELVEVMVTAKREDKIVRAVGAFHSWSPVCVTPGILVNTDKLSGTQRTPTTTLKNPAAASTYYDVLSGTRWKDVVLALEKDGRGIMNMGGYAGLHIVGSTSTGVHGSGLKLPPLAGMFRGVTLVSNKFDSSGTPTIYRIEPSNGITDPTKHSGPIVLLQDDETFNAVIVGLGAFGVIHSVTIETVPFYWIEETRQLVPWAEAKTLLSHGPTGDILKYHNADVVLNPYTQQALITRRSVRTTPPPEDEIHSTLSSWATFIQRLPALKSVFDAMNLNQPLDDIIWGLGTTLALLLKAFPLIVPFVVNIALSTQYHAKPKTGKYYEIYDIGFAARLPAISIEISYPMSKHIAAIDSAITHFEELRQQDISKAVVGFLSARFTSGIGANLSMSYAPDPTTSPGRCYLSLLTLFAFYKSIEAFDEVAGPLQMRSIEEFQGRLHWGEYFTPSFTTLMYKEHDPEFFASIASFKKIAERFDPDHRMWNDFMNRTIWSVV